MNHERAVNNRRLQAMMEFMQRVHGMKVEAVFHGPRHGPDGRVRLPKGLIGCRFIDGQWAPVEMPSGDYPLEVGSIATSTARYRMLRGRMARWAYGKTHLQIIAVTDGIAPSDFPANLIATSPLHAIYKQHRAAQREQSTS
jgi:hypothetical protein